jgi:hypothetical protein
MIRSIVAVILLGCGFSRAEAPVQRVGQPLEIREIYIPGGEVIPKPRRDRQPPLMVRVLEVKPAKDGSRYDFEVQGLEPGTYDLADFLEAPAGTTLPEIPLEIISGLEPGLVVPGPAAPGQLPDLGGYRTTLVALAAAWLAGLIGILLWRKKKPSAEVDPSAAAVPLTDRLRPLVAAAAKGGLSSDDRAKLERLVIGHWRERRPDIAAFAPAEAMVKLRHDPEAAPLILALERWLHAPADHTSTSDLEKLLAPYQSTP